MKRILVLSLLCLLAISCVQNRKADSASSKEVIEVEGRQGVACDGEFYYVSGSTALYKYTIDGELVLSNENPFTSITAGSPAPNHIGDIDVYKGEIYAGCEYFMDGEGKNIQVAIYDAGTLEYKRSITWEKESGQVECCGLAVDRKRDLVWMADWVNGSHLYCYDLSDGSYIGKVALNPAPSLQQGIFCLDDGRILISCDDGDADKDEADHLYVCLPYKDSGKTLLDEAEVSLYMNMTSFRKAGEIEGLCVNPLSGELVVLSNRGARIVLGMPKGFYDGYDREIHELYVMTLVPKMAWSQIDIHSHMIPSSYLEAVKAHGMEMDEGFPIPSWSEENHLTFMDEAGIKTSVLTMPAPQPYFGDGKESAAICRKFNEEAAALKALHPGRFLFCAVLPLPDVDRALKEAKYALEVLGADGVKLATNSYGQYLGDESLEPLMAYLNSRKAVIITHPHKPSAVNDKLISAVPLASYEYLAETTRAILNMVAHDVLVRYPDLKVVVPHCGSFLPNALPRFKSLLPVMVAQGYMKKVDVDANISHLYFDLAGAPTDDALESLLTICEPSHILYGSDYPYVAEARLSAHGLSPKDVFSDNAARLFGTEINTNNLDNIDMNQALTPRRKGLAVIAAFEAKGDQAGLSKALTEALDNGLTISEAKEALSQLYAYTGFPRSLNALGTLQKMLAARKAEGINDNPGKEADPLPDDYDALKQGTSVQTQLTGKPFEYSFVPATDYYLKAHLFGDIFARNNLTFADREIVTVSAISALQGCEPQLIAHVSGARNMGVTNDELRALPALLEEKVGHEEAERLRGALSAVLEH